MHIKFLKNRDASIQKAINYLLGDKGNKGTGSQVEVQPCDQKNVVNDTSKLGFANCYNSGVIAWSSEDKLTRK